MAIFKRIIINEQCKKADRMDRGKANLFFLYQIGEVTQSTLREYENMHKHTTFEVCFLCAESVCCLSVR